MYKVVKDDAMRQSRRVGRRSSKQDKTTEEGNPIVGLTSKEAASRVGLTLRQAPQRLRTYRRAIQLAISNIRGLLTWLGVVLVLFILHQAFIWLDKDPEAAFNQAAQLIEISELTWDAGAVFTNAGVDVLNSGILPLWNGATFYFVEPIVMLFIEMFSIAFLDRSYNGVFEEGKYTYNGFDCTANAEAAEWCGRYNFYASRLEDAEHSTHYVNESDTYERRRLSDAVPNQNFTFGTRTARRLSALALGADFVIPTFEIDDLLLAINDLSMLALTLGSILGDVGAGIAYEIVSTSFSFIVDAFFTVVKTALEVLKMLVKTGMLSTIVNVGIDFIIVSFTEVALPLLFAGIDFLRCVLNLFDSESWLEQLSCAQVKCFQGPDGAADLLIFTSVPVILTQITKVVEATVNSRTARLFVGSDKKISSKGRTRDPVTGEAIPNEEPDNAENPTPDIEFVKDVEDFFFSPETQSCADCFVCRFPEMRAVWLVVTTIASLVSETNFYKFSGNVTNACMNNGSYYTLVCGPRGAGAEAIPFELWKNFYTAGYDPIDPRIFDAFASEMHDRGTETENAQAIAAGDAWLLRSKELPEEQQGAQFVYLMCRIMRESDAGAEFDTGPDFHNYASGSFSYISARFLYENCKRHKHEVAGDASRFAHDLGYEVAACVRNQVEYANFIFEPYTNPALA